MKNKTVLFSGLGLLMALSVSWGQGRPMNGGQQQVQEVRNAFVGITPASVLAGEAVTLEFAFRNTVQAPPVQVNPTSANLGAASTQSVVRDGDNFTAVFTIDANEAVGAIDLTVRFPGPNGTLVFEQESAVSVGSTNSSPIEEPVVEPEPIPATEPEEADEPEPVTDPPSEVTNVPTSSAELSVLARNGAGEVIVRVKGDPGSTWQLQVTSDLTQWNDFATVEIDSSGTGSVDISSLAGSPNFLRGVSSTTTSVGGEEPVDPVGSPQDIYTMFSDNVEVFEDGDMIVLRSTGVPNHASPYFGIGHALYEAYNGENGSFHQNPNSIDEQDLVFRVPKSPSPAVNPSATPLGPIGVSINGVPFFNQYAGPNNQPLTNEIDSFDQYGGHPAQRGNYHYHVEPLFLRVCLKNQKTPAIRPIC